MTRKIHARDITLNDLKKQFNLLMSDSPDFFSEWHTDLPTISDDDKRGLDKIRQGYFNLLNQPDAIEDTIKMVVLSPLLYIADYYLHPLMVKAENPIRLTTTDDDAGEEIVVEGKIDVLVWREHLWVMVIESKRLAYSLESGFAQMLAYMLASPNVEQGTPSYGMITNGGSFIFLKVAHDGDGLKYATSRPFALHTPGSDTYSILQILKRLEKILFVT
ncbi:MAG: restriction endonuclease subunit R [Chloroflexota bacterium]